MTNAQESTGARFVMPYRRWEQHWLRCWRWYHRLGDACGRGDGPAVVDEAPDYAEALCQSIWHLKDWLKNDPRQTTIDDKKVEDFANGDEQLVVVADLANGSKHLVVTGRGDRSGKAKFGATTWTGDGDIDDPASVLEVDVSVDLGNDEDSVEVIDVALAAMNAWERFLTAHGLDVPSDPAAGEHSKRNR